MSSEKGFPTAVDPAERILVAGGGIGGLAVAVALRRAGVPVLVLERAAELRQVEVGAGITLWPNAVAALDRLGLTDEVRARGHVFERFTQRTVSGSTIMSWSLTDWSKRLGFPTLGIARPDLHAVLADAARSMVATGCECSSFEDGPAGVAVNLRDGRREHGRALVGADGIRSVIREQLLGPAPPRFVGLSMWRANVDLQPDAIPSDSFSLFWGRGLSFTYFRLSPSRYTWQGVFRAEAADGQDPKGRRAAALGRFGTWPEPIPSMILATPEESIIRTDVFDRPPDEHWSRGSVTLLGDAAHAMVFKVGQGAGQALEDAISLGEVLGHAESIPAALREYEQRRIPRTTHWQKAASQRARAARLKGRVSCGARNGIFRVAARAIERAEQRAIADGIAPTPDVGVKPGDGVPVTYDRA